MFNTGIVTKIKGAIDSIRYNEINYIPTKIESPPKLVQSNSQAWVGLEKIVLDIIEFSKIKTSVALEFGVEFGYSTAVFANYFEKVIGVDIFTGDIHAGQHGDLFESTKNNLRAFPNIELIKSDYKDFIKANQNFFDLVHVDIIHTYEDTYACGLWGAQHSACTLFHDTQSFPDVKKAVADVAKRTGKKFYNYRKCNGLGILV
jgi:Methyltransferase domain